ncbi:basic proline-rich protein-like [Phyllostomus hastatus]|uniref:basic proline-rich protein-like n=1 Tax=Phyllostomus hastatus TaxID=9423 RepID=UPI001E67F13C|nr:basic proline-rich protein-like [Phyllostomus hastatus]
MAAERTPAHRLLLGPDARSRRRDRSGTAATGTAPPASGGGGGRSQTRAPTATATAGLSQGQGVRPAPKALGRRLSDLGVSGPQESGPRGVSSTASVHTGLPRRVGIPAPPPRREEAHPQHRPPHDQEDRTPSAASTASSHSLTRHREAAEKARNYRGDLSDTRVLAHPRAETGAQATGTAHGSAGPRAPAPRKRRRQDTVRALAAPARAHPGAGEPSAALSGTLQEAAAPPAGPLRGEGGRRPQRTSLAPHPVRERAPGDARPQDEALLWVCGQLPRAAPRRGPERCPPDRRLQATPRPPPAASHNEEAGAAPGPQSPERGRKGDTGLQVLCSVTWGPARRTVRLRWGPPPPGPAEVRVRFWGPRPGRPLRAPGCDVGFCRCPGWCSCLLRKHLRCCNAARECHLCDARRSRASLPGVCGACEGVQRATPAPVSTWKHDHNARLTDDTLGRCPRLGTPRLQPGPRALSRPSNACPSPGDGLPGRRCSEGEWRPEQETPPTGAAADGRGECAPNGRRPSPLLTPRLKSPPERRKGRGGPDDPARPHRAPAGHNTQGPGARSGGRRPSCLKRRAQHAVLGSEAAGKPRSASPARLCHRGAPRANSEDAPSRPRHPPSLSHRATGHGAPASPLSGPPTGTSSPPARAALGVSSSHRAGRGAAPRPPGAAPPRSSARGKTPGRQPAAAAWRPRPQQRARERRDGADGRAHRRKPDGAPHPAAARRPAEGHTTAGAPALPARPPGAHPPRRLAGVAPVTTGRPADAARTHAGTGPGAEPRPQDVPGTVSARERQSYPSQGRAGRRPLGDESARRARAALRASGCQGADAVAGPGARPRPVPPTRTAGPTPPPQPGRRHLLSPAGARPGAEAAALGRPGPGAAAPALPPAPACGPRRPAPPPGSRTPLTSTPRPLESCSHFLRAQEKERASDRAGERSSDRPTARRSPARRPTHERKQLGRTCPQGPEGRGGEAVTVREGEGLRQTCGLLADRIGADSRGPRAGLPRSADLAGELLLPSGALGTGHSPRGQ